MAHLSYSGLRIWKECPFKYKLNYVEDKKKFAGNSYTAFGNAMHTVCEKIVMKEWEQEEASSRFRECFIEEVDLLPEEEKENFDMAEMGCQGLGLAELAVPALEKFFGKFEVISSEEELLEPIDGTDTMFKGFVDLIIRTEDGKIRIIDWKTCSWGWDARKKSDKMVTYQLTLYKYFLARKHGWHTKDMETYFALLKRTAKKKRVEIFRVTSGQIKIKNAVRLLDNALASVDKNFFPKNRMSCFRCEFHRTEDCP
jgi:ATP-dependent exoDNAse (exonuclease V) beta subunit